MRESVLSPVISKKGAFSGSFTSRVMASASGFGSSGRTTMPASAVAISIADSLSGATAAAMGLPAAKYEVNFSAKTCFARFLVGSAAEYPRRRGPSGNQLLIEVRKTTF
jgi:hypothetical protein